jgi:Ca2+-binding EF-hand superfamily protein
MPRLTAEERAKRLSDAFARLDANKDGRVTFEEFRQDLERR